MEYDEDKVLTDYIWHNYRALMTDAELFGHKAVAKAAHDTELEAMYEARFGAEVWQEMQNAVRDNYSAFRKIVRDRLLLEFRELIVITKCPRCQRLVKTPQAKQCLWCGNDWHDRTST